MTQKPSQDINQELEYQARQAELAGSVKPTPAATIERYRLHKEWQYFSREYVFYAIEKCQPKTICDFGCGAGETSTELGAMGYQVTGFDLSPDLIAMATRRAELDKVTDRVEFFIGDAKTLDLKSGSFDLVVVLGVLHHLVDVKQGLKTLESLIKPGGYVVIKEPIVLSGFLRWLRNFVPVERDISPNERQLYREDLELIESVFEVKEKRFFHLFGRLVRLFPERFAGLHNLACQFFWRLDYVVINYLPGAAHFAGAVVYTCKKRGS